jgi:uncharacterized membrane protein
MAWVQLLLRSLHVVVGIAWIGASFYFVWLDNHLEKPQDPVLTSKGVDGELWAVHGGGFYNPQKYSVAPAGLPERLHWFYWESYSTWLSGFALFVAIYLFQADTYLLDARVLTWTKGPAIAAALGFLVLGWIVYDLLCRFIGMGKDPAEQVFRESFLGLMIAALVAFCSWLACELFASRAAFMIVGAMLATIMSANVLMVIIPGQRKVIEAMRAGKTPDRIHGKRGKQRSVHNTYFTLPVLFAMLSNHYPNVYQAKHPWVLLCLLMGAGAIIRFWFVQRHKAAQKPWPWVLAALLVGLSVMLSGSKPEIEAPKLVTLPQPIWSLVQDKCVSCHQQSNASKQIRLDDPSLVITQRDAIYQQVVITRQMPFNNATGITEDERRLFANWFEESAQPPIRR